MGLSNNKQELICELVFLYSMRLSVQWCKAVLGMSMSVSRDYAYI